MADEKTQPLKEGKDTSEGKLASKAGWIAIVMMVAGLITTYMPGLLEHLSEDTTIYVVVGGLIAVAGLVTKVLVTLGYARARTNLKIPLIEILKEQEANKGKAIQAQVLANVHRNKPADQEAKPENGGPVGDG